MRTLYQDRPETLLAVVDAFPAEGVKGDAATVVEKERPFQLFCFGESPSPSYSKKKILFELLRKRLDFIRLSDYNII